MESVQQQHIDNYCVICFGKIKTKNIATSAEELKKVFNNCVTFLDNLIVIEPCQNKYGLVFCDLCLDFESHTAKFTEHISSLQKKLLNLRLAFSAGVTHRRNKFFETKKRTAETTGGRVIRISESNNASIVQTHPPPTTAIYVKNVQVIELPSADILLSETLIESVKEYQSIDNVIGEANPENVKNTLADPEVANSENGDIMTNSDLMKTVIPPINNLNRSSLDTTKIREESVCGNSCENNSPLKKNVTENYYHQPNTRLRRSKYRGIQLNQKSPFKCSKCHNTFQNALSLHLKMHCKQKIRQQCATTKRTVHTNHKKSNPKVGKEKLPCSFCQKWFTPYYLTQHEKCHTGKGNYQCEICGKMFITSSHLIRHNATHSNVKAHKCKTFQKKFLSKSNLKIHKVIHTNGRRYKCEICRRYFARKSHLEYHEVTHTNARPYKCEVCGKTFRRKSNLQSHEVIHTNERPYKCEVCDKTFQWKSSLQSHVVIHTNVRYKCEICNKEYLHKSNLTRHETIHAKNDGHKCSFCNEIYSSARNLKFHEKMHKKGSEYQCNFCKKKFRHFYQLDTHIRSHTKEKPYKCSLCEKAFSCREYVTSHERIHSHHYFYECSFCKKGFNFATSFDNHMRRHVGERPYICAVCKKEFFHLVQLKNHEKVHAHATETQAE